ncbi:MAG: serine/threonine-protein kinase [Bacillota bacterium]|nr:serine/threonine-protein kinase [Bacillota bacterium]
MSEKRPYINRESIKAQALQKYSTREEVTKKWISLYKKLNPSKTSTDYNTSIIEAISVSEFVIENALKNEFVEGRFIDNINKLIEKGCRISNDEFNKLKRIKWFRNIAAHNTETVIQEIINYESARDTFASIGMLLYRLGMLAQEDIIPSNDKLRANIGETIGGTCLLQETIGQGGSGHVFKAYHNRLDSTVAVKELDHELISRIDAANEKNMLLSLRHDGIPRIYDIIEDNHTCYLIMDYIEGQTLEEYISKMGKLNINAALRLAVELCGIISYLHNFNGGIIFRDLKPGNIMLDRTNHVHLIDFGISERAEAKDRSKGIYSGTSNYSSPEQLNGEICDKRTDIYSLGAVLYFMVEGQNPVGNGEQSYKRSTPGKVINIIEKAMSDNKENRYSSAQEFVMDINNFQRIQGETQTNNSGMPNQQPISNQQQIYNNGQRYNGHSGNADVTTDKTLNERNVPRDTTKNGKRLMIPLILIVTIFLIAGGFFVYKLGQNGSSAGNNDQKVVASGTNNKNTTTSDSNSQQTTEQTTTNNQTPQGNDQQKQPDSTNSSKPLSSTAFNGKAVLTVTDYSIAGDSLAVNVTIENNYKETFTISSSDVYVMGDNGTKFSLDPYEALEQNYASINVVPGEKKELKLTFHDYKDSKSLTFNVSRIYCMPIDQTFKVKIK